MLNNEEQILFDLYKSDTPEGTMSNLKTVELMIEDQGMRQSVRALMEKLAADPWIGIG